MGYTFVSYAREQLYFAESVVLALQRSGLEMWFDLQRLTPGTAWAAALKDGAERCERLVLTCGVFALLVFVEGEATQMLLALPFLIPYFLCAQVLITRSRPLPAFLSRAFGSSLAWFAAPAPMASDPIGNDNLRLRRHKDFRLFKNTNAPEEE